MTDYEFFWPRCQAYADLKGAVSGIRDLLADGTITAQRAVDLLREADAKCDAALQRVRASLVVHAAGLQAPEGPS